MKPTPTYVNKPTSDNPRDVECWALAEAARRLISASHAKDEEAFQAALQLNQRLWTIFQAALTEEDCGHPREVQTNLAALSLLVDRETTARLIDMDFAKIDTLVAVNRSVASGLMAQNDYIAAQAAAGQPVPTGPAPNAVPPGIGGGVPGLRPAAAAMPRPPVPAADAPAINRESLRISI